MQNQEERGASGGGGGGRDGGDKVDDSAARRMGRRQSSVCVGPNESEPHTHSEGDMRGVCDTMIQSSATTLPSPSHSARLQPGLSRRQAVVKSRSPRKMVDADGNGEYFVEEPDDHQTTLSLGVGKGAATIHEYYEEYEKHGESFEAKAEVHVRFSESSVIERTPPSRNECETFESRGGGGLTSGDKDVITRVNTSNNFETNGQPSLDITGWGSGECVSDAQDGCLDVGYTPIKRTGTIRQQYHRGWRNCFWRSGRCCNA